MNESVSIATSNGSPGHPDTAGGRVLSAQGLPSSDDYALAPSPHRFDDGGHFRLEVSGVERLATLEALLDEADKEDVYIHRIVAFGAGATLLDRGELKAFAELADEHEIDVSPARGRARAGTRGRQALTSEGIVLRSSRARRRQPALPARRLPARVRGAASGASSSGTRASSTS